MHLRLLVAIALCGAVFARGAESAQPAQPEPRSLTLEECIDLALSRNLDLQIQQLGAQIAHFNLEGTYGAYDPVLTVRAVRDYVSQPGDFDPQKFNPDFPYEMTTDTTGLGLSGNLPIGLSYQFDTRIGKKSAVTDFRSDFEDGRNFFGGYRVTNNAFADVGFGLRQRLLRDFWIDQDRELIRIRRKDVQISEHSVRFQIMKAVLAVELGYFDLVAAREQIRAEEKSLELKQQFVAETRRRVEVGDLPSLDADQAETQLQNILTRLTQARELYSSRQNALKGLLTDDFLDWADVEVTPREPLVAVPVQVQRSECFQHALSNRPDLAEARLAVEKRDVSVKFRYNQLFPTLDLVGRYGGLGVQPQPGEALDAAYNFSSPVYSYGVVMSYPLSSVAERNAYRASKVARQMAELQLQKAEQAVFLDVADWVNRVQSRYAQTGSTRKARGFAEAALEAEQKKLQNGLSTSFFVLQLQETLAMSRIAEVAALADYNKALAQLAFAEGRTLKNHRLRIEVK